MSGRAEADPSETAGDVVFTNVRVFDGRQVLHGTDTVGVAGGLITELGGEGRGRPGEQVVDGSGATLLPGLIDHPITGTWRPRTVLNGLHSAKTR